MLDYVLNDLQVPALFNQWMREQPSPSLTRKGFNKYTGGAGKNWLDGTAVPPLERMSDILSYFGKEKDAAAREKLTVAIDHDHALRPKNIEYKKEDCAAFGKAFSEWANSNVQKGHSLQSLLEAGIPKSLYSKYCKGQTILELSTLRRVIEKRKFSFDEFRPVIEAAFKARQLGKYETLAEVIAQMDTITDSGHLLRRVRQAQLLELPEVSKAMPEAGRVTAQSLMKYEHGIFEYLQHKESLADGLKLKGKNREAFLAAVKRTHGIKDMGQIFQNLAGYDSAFALIQDILAAQDMGINAFRSATNYWRYQIPDTGLTQKIARELKLDDKQTAQFTEKINALRKIEITERWGHGNGDGRSGIAI